MKRLATISAIALLATASVLQAGNYPRHELLIEPADLAKLNGRKGLVILDARSKAAFEAGHVPGAQWVDHAGWAKSFGYGQDAGGWSKRIAILGISADSRVIIYDDTQAKAARVWWILKYWGLKDARLLNGGWMGWESGKYPREKKAAALAQGTFKAVATPNRLATKDSLLKSLPGKSLQLVDSRSQGEFCGTVSLKNKRAGAIPGAKRLEWIDLINKETRRFKPPEELKRLFADAGIKLDHPSAAYCQSGGRASVVAFGLELMGAKNVRNYYKSWAEWGNADDTPVVKSAPKKE